MRSKTQQLRQLLIATVLGSTLTSVAAAQATISGLITGRESSQPLGDVRVTVVGSTITTTTNAEGRYTLRNVPPGVQAVRALRLGYQEGKKQITVQSGVGVTMDLDFVLSQSALQLTEVVTTATGQERRVEVGNAIANVNAATRVAETPVHSVAELILANAPGVVIAPSNMSGGGQTIRIRGLNSLSRSNAPIYVVDGVRVDGGSGGMGGTGGTNSSRLNDINPEEIENVEVVRGPSAATLYGTDAANGVIVITTKKGRAGRSRWNLSSEYGQIEDKNNYEKTWAIWGHAPATPTTTTRCTIVTLADKTCVQDSLTFAHMLRDERFSPIATGNRQLHTLQLSGGTDVVRYFSSGTIESETGPVRMPDIDRAWLASQKVTLRDEWANPERLDRGSFRTNVNAAVSPTFDLGISTMFLRSEQRLPQVDNNVNSFYYNALTNPGFYPGANCAVTPPAPSPCLGYSSIGASPLFNPLYGWAQFTPAHIMQRTVLEGVKRFVGSGTGSWRPRSWLQNDATVGVDFVARRNNQLCRFEECPNFGTQRLGSVNDNHNNARLFTANVRSTGTYNLPESWGSLRTTVGGDYINNQDDGSNASSTILPPGGQTVGSGAVKNASNTLPTATKTLGYYLQEQWSFKDRLWVTGAVRTDKNTAFGTNYQGVYYPKAMVSWLASEESFFPHIDLINSVRLRGAFGSSGVQPGATQALETLNSTTVSLVSDQPALIADQIGNVKLKPELTTEYEAGLDIDAWQNRVRMEATYYSKLTSDAIVNVNIATSAGAGTGSVPKNLGKVKNAGFEASLTTQILDRRNFAWDVTVSGSHNDNKVISLGLDDQGKPIPTIGTTTRTQAGYALNSFFLVDYNYADINNDGLISAREITVNGLDTVYVGQAFAPNQAAVISGIELLDRQVRINASFDHRGGHMILNNTRQFLCTQTNTCIEKSNPSTELELQARNVAANYPTIRSSIGYYEKGDFWRFRELALTADVPQRYVKYVWSRNLSVTLGARNLKVWSKYTAEDPEANYSQGDTPSTLLTTGPRRYYTVRVNAQF
jgi:TonB-linked SusC/RagA family outer membrane protein